MKTAVGTQAPPTPTFTFLLPVSPEQSSIPESIHMHAWSRPEAPSNLEAAGAAQAILTSGRTHAPGLARPGQVQGDLGGKTFCLSG